MAASRRRHRAHDVAQPRVVGAPQSEELVEAGSRGRLQKRFEGDDAGVGLLGEAVDVFVSGAAVERKVDVRAGGHRRDAGADGAGAVGGDLGDRHLEDRGDAAGRGRRRARGEILTRRHAGVARMDVRVNQSRQQVQPACIDDLGGWRAGRRVEQRGDGAIANGDRRR